MGSTGILFPVSPDGKRHNHSQNHISLRIRTHDLSMFLLAGIAARFTRFVSRALLRAASFHRHPKLRLPFLAFLIGIAVCVSAAGPANAAPGRSFDTAIIDGTAFEEGSDAAFKNAANTGSRYIKNNLYWNWIVQNRESADRPGNPQQPFDPTDPASPYYDWTTYDRLVRKAQAQGMEVVLSVVTTPRWARSAACQDTAICSPKPADYADFATAAARRYSGNFNPSDGKGVLPRVRFWQAWVEPNLYLFYAPIFDPNGQAAAPYSFRRILNAFYDAVHAVNPANFVIAGGLAPNSVRGKAIAPLDFSRQVFCIDRDLRPIPACKGAVKADAWSVHPYTAGSPVRAPSSPDNMTIAALPRMGELIRAAQKAGRLVSDRGQTQFWVTEFSWDSAPPDPGGVPQTLLARWVAQAMYIMYQANVQTMAWFGLRDQARDGSLPWSQTFESGLYLRGQSVAEDQPKLVLNVFRFPFYAEIVRNRGVSFWGRTGNSKPAAVDLFARRSPRGSYFRVKTVKANSNGIFSGLLKGQGLTDQGSVYAKVRGGEASVPFGLYRTRDQYQPPFG